MSLSAVLTLIDIVDKSGGQGFDILEGTTVTREDLSNIHLNVNSIDFGKMAKKAISITQNEALGFHLGKRFWGLGLNPNQSQVLFCCKNLYECIKMHIRYQKLWSESVRFKVNRDLHKTSVEFQVIDKDYPSLFSHEVFYIGFRITCAKALGVDISKIEISVEAPYTKPAHAEVYYELLGNNIQFDRPTAKITYDSSLNDITFPGYNPVLKDTLVKDLDSLVLTIEKSQSVSSKTITILSDQIHNLPTLPEISKRLNMSDRTYSRRLELEGTNFRELLKKVRLDHATKLLTETSMSISSIAISLGFHDPSNFKRAYLNWSGKSTQEVRSKDDINS